MDNQVFREKSLERIASPEALGDYLHVTSPAVWMILTAVVLLLAGMLIWSSIASIDSFATGTAQVTGGSMRLRFDDETVARSVQAGMTVVVGETQSRVSSVGTDSEGRLFASAPTTLADGNYPAKVIFRQTQVLSLLFN